MNKRFAALSAVLVSTTMFALSTAGTAAASSDPLADGPPSVVAESTSASAPGLGFQVQITCTAKANQLTAQVTVIEACYTTNGVTAPPRTTAGYATSTAISAIGRIEDWSVCIRAYSIDANSVKSPVKSVCKPWNQLLGAAVIAE